METISIKDWKRKIKESEEIIKNKSENSESLQYHSSQIEQFNTLIDKDLMDLKQLKEKASTPMINDDRRVDIIVLDTENSRDLTRKCVDLILQKTEYPFNLTVYDNTLNTANTSKIWNKLIKNSNCGYVMVIDNDAFVQNRGWLKNMVEVLEKYPDVAVVGPVAGNSAVTTCQKTTHTDFPEFQNNGHISGYCMLFKKSIFEEYRYFDENFYFYGQESDWIEQILEERKYKIYVVKKAFVYHGDDQEGSSIASMRDEKEGKIDRRLDSEYSKALFEKKKNERKKIQEKK